MKTLQDIETRRISLFLFITFGLAYVWTMLLIWPRVLGVDTTSFTPDEQLAHTITTTALTAVLMFFPAIGVLVARLVTREGFKNSMLCLNLKGNVRYYLIGWFAPMVLTLLGGLLYFAIYPSEFTLASYHAAMEVKPMPPVLIVLLLLMTPLFNLVPCLGEEWGWRGYLLPKVAQRMKFLPTVLLTGFIWGLWHAPIIVAGHNYGMQYPGYPWAGIAAMCLFCIVAGTLLSCITLKAKSCWPAVLAHGAINGTASVGVLFLADPMNYDRFLGPAPTGIIGAAFYILVAVGILWCMRKR